MIPFLFPTGNHGEREQRLLGVNTGGGAEDKSFIRRMADSIQNAGAKKVENILDPEVARERERLDDSAKLQAFQQPNIFTAAKNARSNTGNINIDGLMAKEPLRRLQEFEGFVRERIPASIQSRPEYAELFGKTLDQADLDDYAELGNVPSRIRLMLQILSSMQGNAVQDPVAADIAKRALFEKNNAAEAPGTLVTMYEDWLDKNPALSETLATDPEYLLKPGSGIDTELRGLIEKLDPLQRSPLLLEMYKERRIFQNDHQLANLDAELDFAKLNQSVLKNQKLKEATDIVTNFNNLNAPWKLLFIGVGAAAVWQAFRSKNPLGRYALYGIAGYLAYDKLINGNTDAVNDMAGGFQKFAKMSKEKIADLAASMGLIGPRVSNDRLATMARFLEKNKLPLEIATTQNGLAALANVNLGTIAGAFRPYDEEGDEIGGELSIDDGQTQVASLGGYYEREPNPAGTLLHEELKLTLDKMGLRSDERDANITYLHNNSRDVGKAVSHVFYMLAADKPEHQASVKSIKEGLKQTSYNFDLLPKSLKRLYMQIVNKGRKIAKDVYAGKSLMQVIASLNEKDDGVSVRPPDTAATVLDPKLPARIDEFTTLEEIRKMDADPLHYKEITDRDGLLDRDAQEFIRNCVTSGLVKSGTALDRPEDSADTLLRRKFDDLRNSEKPLTDILEAFEKLKYAITVASTKQQEPLTRDQLIQMVGPDDLSPSSLLNTIEDYMARIYISLPRGFQSVSSLSGVNSLMTEPWLGSGPLNSTGTNFTKLREKVDTYQLKFAELRKPEVVAKRIVQTLPMSTINLLGDKDSAILFITKIIKDSNFSDWMNRTEGSLSRRLAWALARSMRLNANPDNYGDNLDDLTVTRTEQLNLEIEFDRMYYEIVGDADKVTAGMWSRVEDIDIYDKYDLDALEGFDYSTESKRMKAITYACDLGMLYLLQIQRGKADPLAKKNMGKRVARISEKILEQYEKEKIDKSEGEITVLGNQPSRKALTDELPNLMKLFEVNSRFGGMLASNTLPPVTSNNLPAGAPLTSNTLPSNTSNVIPPNTSNALPPSANNVLPGTTSNPLPLGTSNVLPASSPLTTNVLPPNTNNALPLGTNNNLPAGSPLTSNTLPQNTNNALGTSNVLPPNMNNALGTSNALPLASSNALPGTSNTLPPGTSNVLPASTNNALTGTSNVLPSGTSNVLPASTNNALTGTSNVLPSGTSNVLPANNAPPGTSNILPESRNNAFIGTSNSLPPGTSNTL